MRGDDRRDARKQQEKSSVVNDGAGHQLAVDAAPLAPDATLAEGAARIEPRPPGSSQPLTP